MQVAAVTRRLGLGPVYHLLLEGLLQLARHLPTHDRPDRCRVRLPIHWIRSGAFLAEGGASLAQSDPVRDSTYLSEQVQPAATLTG